MFELRQRATTQRPQQAGERVAIPQPREAAQAQKAARVSTAPAEERHPPSQPRGGIRIVEGGESRPPQPRIKILVSTDISILRFYEYIGNISMNIFT